MEDTRRSECGRISDHPHDDFGAKSTLTDSNGQGDVMKRVVFSLIWILTASLVSYSQSLFYYPHIVNGVQGSVIWKTTILLTNPASSGTVSGTISFTQDNSNLRIAGSPLTLTLTDESGATATQSSFTFSIPSGGIRKLVSTGEGQFAQGFATVNANSGSVSGTAIFSEFDGA